jgi:putative hemolysin
MTRQAGTLTDLRGICHPPLVIPDGVHLDALLDLFRQHRIQIAIVVDEYGSTAGLVTFEDITEEVTGEVQDVLEPADPPVRLLEDGRILLRGQLRLDELDELLGWDLEDDSVDTIAGLIMKRLGRVAKVGDRIEMPYGTLEVTKMVKARITEVAVIPRVVSQPNEAESFI